MSSDVIRVESVVACDLIDGDLTRLGQDPHRHVVDLQPSSHIPGRQQGFHRDQPVVALDQERSRLP
jgi:hypothetical protein